MPETGESRTYSGKLLMRVPKRLHRQLVEQAKRQNVSMNQYVNYLLARAIGVEAGLEGEEEAT